MARNKKQTPLLEFKNITVYRGETKALDNIDLTIPKGQDVAILGPNGSGKSTLIKTITHECYAWQGNPKSSIKIFGEVLWNIFDLQDKLGIVTNDLMQTCSRDITAMELILSGFFSSIGLWQGQQVTKAMEKKARQALTQMEALPLAQRLVSHLSDGQARRILISRALVHDPQALLLDEPFNSLDPKASYDLKNILGKLARSGRNIILATHQFSDIIPEITRVIFMKEGRIYLDGSREKVLTSKNLTALFDFPVGKQSTYKLPDGAL